MYIRRKHYEHGRIKRNTRKSKTFEAFNSIFGTYFKLLLIWATVLMLDFFTDFRFEFIYSCWLFVRTVIDSFRYQGLAFALFFTLIALTSDLICYFLLPTALIYLLGSSLVWVQLVWQADRGVYGPTMVFCFLFIYVEVAVRLRDPKSLPLSIDLCRPFAAHCIGYPAVTLGFGLKTMVAHHLRLRRQRSVEAQNMTFFALLEEALPKEFRYYFKSDLPSKSKRESPISSNPAITAPNLVNSHRTSGVLAGPTDKLHPSTTSRKQTHNINTSNTGPKPDTLLISANLVDLPETVECISSRGELFNLNRSQPNQGSNPELLQHECDVPSEIDRFPKTSNPPGAVTPKSAPWTATKGSTALDVLDDESCLPDSNPSRPVSSHKPTATHCKAPSSVCSTSSSGSSASSSSSSFLLSNGPLSSNSAGLSSSCPNTRSMTSGKAGGANNGTVTSNATSASKTSATAGGCGGGGGSGGHKPNPSGCKNSHKDEYTLKLETELRQLKSELQSLRALEIDLRTQVQQLTAAERTYRSESAQARQESESLQTKLNQLTQRLQADRANVQAAEKRLAEERKQRLALEQQIAAQQQSQQQANSRSSGKGRRNVTEDSSVQLDGASKNQNTNISRSTSTVSTSFVGACLGGESCASRVQELEAELNALTRDLSAKDIQLTALKDGRASSSSSSLSLKGPSSGNVPVAEQQQRVPALKMSDMPKACESKSHLSTNVSPHDHGHHTDTASLSKANKELVTRLTSLQEENQRLTDTLKEEDKMKQELMTAYHSSLKEITELNATLTKKEYQIVELNMRIDYLTPHLYDYMLNGPMSGSDSQGAVTSAATSSATIKMPHHVNASDNMSGGCALYSAPFLSESLSGSDAVGKLSLYKSDAHDEMMNCADLRLSQFASNGLCQSSQSNSNYLPSVSACNNQNSYVSSTLDGTQRGLCQTTSSGTLSSIDYLTSRINNLPGLQPLISSTMHARLESNRCYGGQQQTIANTRQLRQTLPSINTTTTNTSQYDVSSSAKSPSLHPPYHSIASYNHNSQHNKYKSSSLLNTVNRMHSSCAYPMSSGRPLPVGSSAPPTSPPPFVAPPPGLYNMSNSASSSGQLNGNPGLFHPSSSSALSPDSMAPLDLQSVFASPPPTPLEVAVHSDSHHLPGGYFHSPTEPTNISRSPGSNVTTLTSCLMDSLVATTGQQFFGARQSLDTRDRSLAHALSEVTSSVSGRSHSVTFLGDQSRPRSCVTYGQSFNGSISENFLPGTFDAGELTNTSATITGFLPNELSPLNSSLDRTAPPSSSSELRPSSLDPEKELSIQPEPDTVLTGNKPAPI